MSIIALQLRQVRTGVLSRFKYCTFQRNRALIASLAALMVATGPALATGHQSEWRYWRNGDRPPYPAEFRPLVTVPPMPGRKYRSAVPHGYSSSNPTVYEFEAPGKEDSHTVHSKPPVRKKPRLRHEQKDDYAPEHHDHAYGGSDARDGGNGFGRLFPDAAEDRREEHETLPARALNALGRSMVEDFRKDHPRGDSEQPAGYTFFGQFIDHDITFETETVLGRRITGDHELLNARTPDLDLDSVYGGGPSRTPHLYRLPYIRVGHLISAEDARPRYDLFRTKSSYREGPRGGLPVALIGDPRNDENIIISQLHAAFVALHNRTVDILVQRDHGHAREDYCRDAYECTPQELALALPEADRKQIFETARDHVIHFYHRLILEDFLPRVIGPAHTVNLLKHKRNFYFPEGFVNADGTLASLYIPIEFSFAFRYGHSQVRDSYILRDEVRFDLLSDGESGAPRAFEPVRPRHLVDWRYFFEIGEELPEGFNYARKIDPELVRSLHQLDFPGVVDDGVPSLAARNLARGEAFHMPTGQTIADLILPELETRGLLGLSKDGSQSHDSKLWRAFLLPPDDRIEHFLGDADTPFWYYIVQEAGTFGLPTHIRALPSSAGHKRYSSADHEGGDYRGGLVRASLNYEEQHDHEGRHSSYADGGHRLGPVGATIVGEVMIGLLEHFAEKTGKGLDFEPELKGSLSKLALEKYDEEPRKRYLMRNFLLDAGVVEKPH